jgi:hypothetical protein
MKLEDLLTYNERLLLENKPKHADLIKSINGFDRDYEQTDCGKVYRGCSDWKKVLMEKIIELDDTTSVKQNLTYGLSPVKESYEIFVAAFKDVFSWWDEISKFGKFSTLVNHAIRERDLHATQAERVLYEYDFMSGLTISENLAKEIISGVGILRDQSLFGGEDYFIYSPAFVGPITVYKRRALLTESAQEFIRSLVSRYAEKHFKTLYSHTNAIRHDYGFLFYDDDASVELTLAQNPIAGIGNFHFPVFHYVDVKHPNFFTSRTSFCDTIKQLEDLICGVSDGQE